MSNACIQLVYMYVLIHCLEIHSHIHTMCVVGKYDFHFLSLLPMSHEMKGVEMKYDYKTYEMHAILII